MTRNNVADLLEVGVRRVFHAEYRNRGNQYKRIFNVVGSRKKTETDIIMSGLDRYRRKTEGASPDFDSGQEAWKKTYTHSTFALGISVTEEALEDELYGYYESMGGELGRAAYYTREVEAMDGFNDLSAEAYNAGGTSYALLSTTHYRVDGETWSNRPTVATDLSIDALETALSAWRTNMVDQRGRKVLIQPKVLMVGVSDYWLAKRILGSTQRPQGNDNDPNVIQEADLQVFASDFLTDDGRWFLLASPGETGLTYFDRKPHEMRRRDDTNTGNMLLVGRYRESHGTSHVTGIYGSP